MVRDLRSSESMNDNSADIWDFSLNITAPSKFEISENSKQEQI